MSINPVDLFPRANELFLRGYKEENLLPELGGCTNSISSMVPWSFLTKISIDEGDIVTAAGLELILRMAYTVHTLRINYDSGVLSRAILHNTDNLGTRVNQQVKVCFWK